MHVIGVYISVHRWICICIYASTQLSLTAFPSVFSSFVIEIVDMGQEPDGECQSLRLANSWLSYTSRHKEPFRKCGKLTVLANSETLQAIVATMNEC